MAPFKKPLFQLCADEGRITALSGCELNLHVYGFGLTNDSEIKLSSFPSTPGHICKSDILHVQTRSKYYKQCIVPNLLIHTPIY